MKLTFTATAGQKVSIKLNPVTIGSNAVSGTTVTLLKGTTTVGLPVDVGTNGGYIDVTTLATAGHVHDQGRPAGREHRLADGDSSTRCRPTPRARS